MMRVLCIIASMAAVGCQCGQTAPQKAAVKQMHSVRVAEDYVVDSGTGLTVLHDDKRGVTCWFVQDGVYNGAISCLPDVQFGKGGQP